jgi:hypothetical protein
MTQERIPQAIANHDIVVSIGPAGTGKTYLAVAKAVEALARKRVKRIILARPAVEAGESLGFLPGDLQAKVDPYLRPLYDALEDMMPHDRVQRALETRTIEIAPLAYMRGRTLADAFIILDEAQNATGAQMKMFLTRLGVNSKTVVTGDKTQIDLPRREESGLVQVERVLPGIEGIAFCYLDETEWYGIGWCGDHPGLCGTRAADAAGPASAERGGTARRPVPPGRWLRWRGRSWLYRLPPPAVVVTALPQVGDRRPHRGRRFCSRPRHLRRSPARGSRARDVRPVYRYSPTLDSALGAARSFAELERAEQQATRGVAAARAGLARRDAYSPRTQRRPGPRHHSRGDAFRGVALRGEPARQVASAREIPATPFSRLPT